MPSYMHVALNRVHGRRCPRAASLSMKHDVHAEMAVHMCFYTSSHPRQLVGVQLGICHDDMPALMPRPATGQPLTLAP